MLKTHIKTRWLRLLLLVIALVGLATPKANAYYVFFENKDTKYTDPSVWHYAPNESGTLLKMTQIGSSDYYYANVPDGHTTLIFRPNANWSNQSNTFENCSAGKCYNKTSSWNMKVSVNGGFNSWGEWALSWQSGTKFKMTTASAISTSGQEFLVYINGNNGYKYGGATCSQSGTEYTMTYNGANAKLNMTLPVGSTIEFDVSNGKIKFTAADPKVALYGSFNHGTTSWSSTLQGQKTVTNDDYTYEYTCTSSNPFLFRVDIDGTKYGAKTSDRTPLSSTVQTMSQNDNNSFEVTSPGVSGKITIHVKPSTKEVWATTVAGITASTIQVSKDNGTNWTTVTNNAATATTFSNLAGTEKFLVKITWSDDAVKYYTFNGAPNSTGEKTLVETTSGNGAGINSDIVSVSLKINATAKDNVKANITAITNNAWTFTPANNNTTTSKSITVKKVDSRGNTVYYTHAAITKAGEYTLSSTDTETPVTINMTNPSTKTTWSSGVPTLTVTDLNAGIVKVELINAYSNNSEATFTKHEDEEGIYFTWNGTLNRINENDDVKNNWDRMHYLKATNAAGTTTDWTLSPSSTAWWMGEEVQTLNTKSDDKFIAFKDNNNVSIKVTLKSSNKNQLDKIYRGNAQIKIVGDVAGTNYGESDGKPLELYTINNEGKPVYRYVAGTMQGDKYCRLWINGTQKGNSAGKDQPMGGESNKSTWSNTTNEFQNTFKIPIGNAEKIVKVWVMPNDDKVWFTASDAPISLNIMPRDVREDDNNSYSAWIHDAVYITADYLNNNVLSPDWEMERRKDGTYHIENVTLRSTQSGSGAAANQNITFRVIKPDFTCTNIQINPADFVTLPSGSERQYGYAYDIVYNPSKTGNERFTFTLHKDDDGKEVGKQLPFLSLVGYNFQQNVNGVTPRGKNTDNGWQESWILCDDNGSPMLDNDDNYIYSTVWPPKNPIQFKGVFPDADDLEISSDNIIFSKAEMYDSEDNQIDPILTGAKWKTYVPFVNDINHQYDGLINGISTASSAPGMQRAAAASNGTLAANTKYMRYIVRNVWVLGSIKVWTGWGGQTINDGANWSAHANWGYLTGNDAKFDNNSGNEISSNTAYQMVGFGGNFLFDQPTYFKTVEFYIPVDDEGVPTNVNATPVFYTTVGLGDPRIQAQATKLNGTDKVNNTGRFVPMYDRAKLPDGREAVGYRITRYDATECSSNQDFSRWFPDNKNGNAEVTCTATLDDLEFNYDKMNKKQASSYLWYTEPTTLANGRYFYGLELLDANGNVIDRVASNVFTIANIDVKPSTKALQLLELTERGAELAHLESYGLSWDDKENDKWYLTYQPGNNGDYFVVNGKTKKVTEIDQKHALSAINAHEVVWTTRYFVRAGNVKKFQSDMKEAMKLGVLDAMPEDPQYKFTYTGQDGIEHTVNDNLLVKSTNGTKGYITNFTAGSLKQYTFTSKIQYSYKPKDGEIRYIRFTDEDPDKKYTHEVNTKSYIPGAYDLTYSYKTEIDNNAAFDPEVELYTTSSVFDSEGNFMTLPSNGVPANDVTPALKKIRVDNLPHRNLNCVFEFKRPNISSELLANYDIYYDVLFDNNDEHLDVLNDAYVYDPTTVAQGEKKYQVIAHQVSPKQAVYPIFVLKGTIYVRKGELATLAAAAGKTPQEYLADQRTVTETADASEYQMYHTPQYKTLTSNGYTGPMLTVEAVNVTEAKPMSINSMTPHCFPHWDGPIKYYGWAIDPGQITFTENGDYVHMDTSAEADQTAEAITMTPAYYDVEAYIPGQVGQITGWNNATNYWNVTPDKAIIEDGVITAANYYSPDHVLRANVSTLGASTSTFDGKIEVARGFLSDAKPTFIFTPVYIFCRKPRPEAQETDDDDADYIGLQVYGKPASSAPRRMGESEEDPNMPVSSTPGNVTSDGKIVPGISTTVNGVEYVVVRGGAGVQEVNATIMTGVEDINVEETTAEYYNMQGIRVPEPEHGQIYIVKYSDGRVARQLYR